MQQEHSTAAGGLLPARTGNAVSIAGVEITADSEGRYNLNALHRASGLGEEKAPPKWLRNKQATELVAELEKETGRICLVSVEGRNGGTFADEVLAISYAGWISPSFQLKVNRAFLDTKAAKFLTPAEMFFEQARMMVEVERKQAALEAEQVEQSKRLATTERRLDQIETATDHFTCVGYARWAKQTSIDLKDAADLGRRASKRCRELGIPVSKIPDPRFGAVNQFPKAILDEAWEEKFGKAA